MSLMKLAPEAVRLRRVARAHALGEFTLAEYRQARREVIENFEPHRAGEDDTQPREENKPENGTRLTAGSAVRRKRRGRSWLMWVLAGVVLLAATRLMAAEGGDGFRIASLAERDPNPATSPRLDVRQVVLADPAVLDNLAVAPSELEEAMAARLAAIRTRNQAGRHGFTPAELEEVGRLLNALGAHDPGRVLTARDAADLTALLADQKARRGVSVVELQEVAAAAQAYLRERGYFLAVAYLPAQTVASGRVRVAVLPGVLGDVRVAGAPDKLGHRFRDLLGRPVTWREINTRLYALNQAPGFSARAGFEPGDAVGETRLHLEVLEQRTFRGNLALDNYGDEHTGRQRLVLGADLINPAGRGDVLRAGLTTALNPGNQIHGFAEYTLPVGGRRQLRGRLARNDFTTGGPDAIDGDGWLLDAVLETYLHRDRIGGLSWEVGVGRHSLDWETPDDRVAQTVDVISGALNVRRVWDEARVVTDLRFYGDVGRIGGDVFAGQDDVFWDVGFDASGWHPFDLAFLPGRQKVSAQIVGQFSRDRLPSTRRLLLGGITAARGFDRDTYLADRGLIVRGDLRTPLALGEIALFADLAYGENRNALTPGWAHLANLGVSWDVRLGQHFTSSLSLAAPITTKGNGDLNDAGMRFFWSLRYGR